MQQLLAATVTMVLVALVIRNAGNFATAIGAFGDAYTNMVNVFLKD